MLTKIIKVASAALGMGPHQTMNIAERLYLSGLITYPRTESTSYPQKFDFKSILHAMTDSSDEIQKFSNKLLAVFYF